jgi:aminocarboxymuconate-semialdehyde decarboxylase
MLIAYSGDYNIIVPEHYDPEARLEALNAAGIDMQVLTLTTPGVHVESPEKGLYLAQGVNDAFAEISGRYPTRFTALAALPLQDSRASVEELERAVKQLSLPGAMLFTNVNGTPLDDPQFWPLFEKAAELDVPLFLHPAVPAEIGSMKAYRLVALVGFLHETTVAITRLVFSGIFQRWPGLKLVLSHLGGTMPYLAERIDLGYWVYPECQHLPYPPSETLKQFHMDTIPHSPNALAFAAEFAGVDKLLLGSDYPHQIGDLVGAVQTIEGLAIPNEDKAKILGENTARLLKLPVLA